MTRTALLRLTLVLLSIAALLPAASAQAQISYDTGCISGKLTMTDGVTPLPNAEVVGQALDTSGSVGVHVDEATGEYLIEEVPVGRYRLEARFGGYPIGVVDEVTVVVAETVEADFTGEVGVLELEVTVDGAPDAQATVWIEEKGPVIGLFPKHHHGFNNKLPTRHLHLPEPRECGRNRPGTPAFLPLSPDYS